MPRKRRPLARQDGELRDARLFVIATEDTYLPKQYFELFRSTRVRIEVLPTDDGKSAPSHVLERMKRWREAHDIEVDDELWLVCDKDRAFEKGAAGPGFNSLKEAREANIQTAVSSPCFELWLLLHHAEPDDLNSESRCAHVVPLLRAVLGSYSKSRLEIGRYDVAAIDRAIECAKRLDSSCESPVPEAPGSHVYRLVERIRQFLKRS